MQTIVYGEQFCVLQFIETNCFYTERDVLPKIFIRAENLSNGKEKYIPIQFTRTIRR